MCSSGVGLLRWWVFTQKFSQFSLMFKVRSQCISAPVTDAPNLCLRYRGRGVVRGRGGVGTGTVQLWKDGRGWSGENPSPGPSGRSSSGPPRWVPSFSGAGSRTHGRVPCRGLVTVMNPGEKFPLGSLRGSLFGSSLTLSFISSRPVGGPATRFSSTVDGLTLGEARRALGGGAPCRSGPPCRSGRKAD